jgi:hypothetical protein
LRQAATLHCVSSRGKANARMVKRRNSPFPSYNRAKRPSTKPDFSPELLKPMPLSPRQRFADLSDFA